MKLTKSRDDVIVSGVLAGLGEYFKLDPTLIRIGVAILIFFSPFPVIPLYIIGAVLIPKAPKKEDKVSRRTSSRRERNVNHERNYEETDKHDEHPSSEVDDINEEDWSDF